jgi:hypothetical protein
MWNPKGTLEVGDLVKFTIMSSMLNGFYTTQKLGLIIEVKIYATSPVCYLVLAEGKEHWIQNRDILEVL